jgi:D-amino-acid dehydrogenase
VLILGAGVIGLSCAWQLLQAGRSVRIIDSKTPGAGSSHGNCGTLTPSHAPPLAGPGVIAKALRWMFQNDAPLYVKPRFDPALWAWMLRFARQCSSEHAERAAVHRAAILLQSRRLLDEFLGQTGIDCEYRNDGLLYAFRDQASLAEYANLPAQLAPLSLEARLLDQSETLALEPALRKEIAGGLLHTQDGHLRPDRLIDGLVREVQHLGGIIETQAEATGFERRAGRIEAVWLRGGRRVQAAETVCALGAWSPQLFRQLSINLPIQPGKGYSITYSRPELCPQRPLVLKERSVCVTSWASGYRLGSTMEFAGYDETLNERRLAALERAAREYLIEPMGPAVQERWYGWRPMTPDDLPLIGPVPGLKGIWLATGHGMLGVSMSAATGLMIRQMMLGQDVDLDPAPFAFSRFDKRGLGFWGSDQERPR